jgi:hypothetical protein
VYVVQEVYENDTIIPLLHFFIATYCFAADEKEAKAEREAQIAFSRLRKGNTKSGDRFGRKSRQRSRQVF